MGLAVTIGMVLVAAGVLAYEQAKDSSGDAKGRAKVADLMTMVETSFTQNGSFPNMATLRAQWQARRPDDWDDSPWGGPVNTALTPVLFLPGVCGSCGILGDENLAAQPAPTTLPGTTGGGVTASTGNLYYYRVAAPGVAAPACCWQLADASKSGAGTSVSGYGVAINKRQQAYYFVQSGRPTQ